MDPLVKAALDKLNRKVEVIFELKESDYVTEDKLEELENLGREAREARLRELHGGTTFEEVKEEAITDAEVAAEALIAAFKTL